MAVNISICVISYNHESFIRDTLHSIADQDFDGSVEVIIGIDLSSDNTLVAAKEAIVDFKWPVKLLEYKERQGMFNNLFNVLSTASGKYIAMLEGDDYWANKDKLSMQFLYMESAQNCVACGGAIKTLTGAQLESRNSALSFLSQYFFTEDLVHANRLSFCTVMFRRSSLDFELLGRLKDSPHLDWPIYHILLKQSKANYIKVFSDTFSVYRIHDSGVYSGVTKEKRLKNVIATMKFNELILDKPKLKFYSLFEKFSGSLASSAPTINELLNKYFLEKESLLSFYMQLFGKKTLVVVMLKSVRYWPLLVSLILRKCYKRFVSPYFFNK